MSDAARKRNMADWIVKAKKQVVKLYAAAKWARDSETVQKCMVCRWRLNFMTAAYSLCVERHRISHESKQAV